MQYFSVFGLFNPPYQGDFKRNCVSPVIKAISVKTERADIYTSPKASNTQQSISLIELMEKFKSITTNRYINGVKQNGWQRFSNKLWERSFHDHVIRNDDALRSVRKYISENVLKWELESKGIVP